MATNFDLAPPRVTVGGITIVPVDFQTIDARLVFNGAGSTVTLTWTAGPRVAWNGGFTDLAPGRYLESWVPANRIWDQYVITLDVSVTGTATDRRGVRRPAQSSLPDHATNLNYLQYV